MDEDSDYYYEDYLIQTREDLNHQITTSTPKNSLSLNNFISDFKSQTFFFDFTTPTPCSVISFKCSYKNSQQNMIISTSFKKPGGMKSGYGVRICVYLNDIRQHTIHYNLFRPPIFLEHCLNLKLKEDKYNRLGYQNFVQRFTNIPADICHDYIRPFLLFDHLESIIAHCLQFIHDEEKKEIIVYSLPS
tara:strand:- start:570 stop:1136 length:567 start_codon:yes stop_codon:yes gene_type:complete